ncbi:E3 ubiquitin-protein ligase RNF167-like [Pantherophis guttatus]|uniref:E3 ubiquitin-protein ligase RNF167-like n=1 Tax=Pantherophis guttatus TaxID=94885 RepID=A0A6P9B659_PANGU|nr:E3 ubiquitin-protein ligase RNF167-like [Pantherophis guttatus]
MRFPFLWPWHMVTLFLILQVISIKAFSHATCNPNSTSLDVGVLPAFFQPLLPPEGLRGLWVKVKPLNPYHRIQGPPPSSTLLVVLFRQHNCSFSKKILHAQQVGSHTAIVHNVSSQMLENMVSEPGAKWHLHIPAVFSAQETAKILKHLHRSGKSLLALPRREHFHFAWKVASTTSDRLEVVRSPCQCLLQPAGFCCQIAMFYTCWIVCLTVSATFIAMMLTEHYLSWSKRKRKNRCLLRQHEKEPVHISLTGSKYQECAICLDRYMQYDGVKVLSCSHAFHSRCIDLWHITQARNKTCPLCMQKVMVVTHLMAMRLWQQEKSVGRCELTENKPYPTCNHISCWQNHAVPISEN